MTEDEEIRREYISISCALVVAFGAMMATLYWLNQIAPA